MSYEAHAKRRGPGAQLPAQRTAVFVYGLLKPGFNLHHVAEPYVVRSVPGWVRGRLYDARGFGGAARDEGLPAARFDEDGEIEGFVLWMDGDRAEEALRALDELEDEGDEYRRVLIDVTTDEGPTRAFAYEYIRRRAGLSYAGRSWGNRS